MVVHVCTYKQRAATIIINHGFEGKGNATRSLRQDYASSRDEFLYISAGRYRGMSNFWIKIPNFMEGDEGQAWRERFAV